MTLVGSIGRKSLDQAMGPGQHASANEKKRKKKHQYRRLVWGSPAACRSGVRHDNNKKRSVLSSMDYGGCFAPHSLTLDLRLRMYGTFSPSCSVTSKIGLAASAVQRWVPHPRHWLLRLSEELAFHTPSALGAACPLCYQVLFLAGPTKNTHIQNPNLHADILGSRFGEVTWR